VISEAIAATPAQIGFRTATTLDRSPKTRDATRFAVSRAKEGDRDALRYLYVSYSNNVYSYVRSIVHDDHEAEDVTQHVFAKLMTTVGKYDERGGPFLSWLLRLARNVAIDQLRANRITPAEVAPDLDALSAEEPDQVETVRAALAVLPEEQRKVVILRHLVGLTPGEIAECMGRTEDSIHGLHHRGRRALQRELERLESMPCTREGRKLAVA
jgi:RNA polymerase sigma-70 factor (ECF subfamily)